MACDILLFGIGICILTYTAEHTAAHTSLLICWNTHANLGQARQAIIIVLLIDFRMDGKKLRYWIT
jgi:hypothetical protein